MSEARTIICAFCRGTGNHPHFTGTCPVCKSRGKNQIRDKFMICPDCYGTGQKRGTTLTCFSCGGLGVVPDTREEFKRARKEIQKAREEMAKERPARHASRACEGVAGGEEFREKSSTKKKRRRRVKIQEEKELDEDSEERSQGSCYCQACASKADRDSILKVCLKCFKKIKGL